MTQAQAQVLQPAVGQPARPAPPSAPKRRVPVPSSFRVSPLERQVGDTPLLDLSWLSGNPGVRILAKAEWRNPGGSVKDRAALRIVRDAIARGDLRPGRTLLDATSGNTGVSYAWLGAAKGFPVKLCISEGANPQRLRLLRALGAQLELTDAAETTDGAIRRARELAAAEPDGYYYADQYGNPSNRLAHETTTGPEVWRQSGRRVTHLVAGLGTTGTLIGTATYLKARNPAVQAVGVQPDAPLHGLEGLKHLPTAITPAIYDPRLVDTHFEVAAEAAYQACRDLARQTGLLVGISAGAAFHACQRLAKTLESGTLVTIFPDAGHQTLHLPFWEAKNAE